MLREVQFRIKKHTKSLIQSLGEVPNVMKDIIKSEQSSLNGEENNFCFKSFKLHMVSGTQLFVRS
jgi:hypothetical protein